jgi:hypothetical protein
MSLTDFKAKMNKSKINKYKINNNNKTNTKHEFNVRYERYKQDISKDTLQMQKLEAQNGAKLGWKHLCKILYKTSSFNSIRPTNMAAVTKNRT